MSNYSMNFGHDTSSCILIAELRDWSRQCGRTMLTTLPVHPVHWTEYDEVTLRGTYFIVIFCSIQSE